MTIDELKALGIDTDTIEEKIIQRASWDLLKSAGVVDIVTADDDEDEDEYSYRESDRTKMARRIREAVDAKIDKVFEEHVAPKIHEMIEETCLQATNTWGEKQGRALTFTEYLVSRADAYISEQVNYNGKSKAEDPYNWHAHSTRITYLIHQHLHFQIKKAMEGALGAVNSSVRKGLQEAVNMALAGIKVEVGTKVAS